MILTIQYPCCGYLYCGVTIMAFLVPRRILYQVYNAIEGSKIYKFEKIISGVTYLERSKWARKVQLPFGLTLLAYNYATNVDNVHQNYYIKKIKKKRYFAAIFKLKGQKNSKFDFLGIMYFTQGFQRRSWSY